MPPSTTRLTLALLLSIALASGARAQVILGTVSEDESDRAIIDAEVQVFDSAGSQTASVLTDRSGRFRVPLENAGRYRLSVTRVGFQPVSRDSISVGRDTAVELRIRLGFQVVPLDPITVVAERGYIPIRIQQFRERAETIERSGRGRVFTRADVDRLRPLSAEQLLNTAIWPPGCRPSIYIDGIEMPTALSTISGDLLEGIEIYRRTTEIPAELYRPGMCALVMVWTRHDPEGMKPLTWARTAVAAVLLVLFIVAAN